MGGQHRSEERQATRLRITTGGSKGTVPIPAGTRKLNIGLQMYGPGQVWFDDIVVEYAD